MVFQSFFKGFKLPALAIAGLGLWIPALPALAVTSNLSHLNSVGDSILAESEELLIAQGGCPRADTLETFETDTYYAYICEDGDGDYFYHGVNKFNGNSVNVYGVTFTDSGYYAATTYDDDGNEYTYMVGPSLEVYQNGESIWYEPTY